MKEGETVAMHQDHQQWESDIAMWRDDVALWKEECLNARSKLTRLEAALCKQLKAIYDHKEAIRSHEENLAGHEHALKEVAEGRQGGDVSPFATAHETEARTHAQQRAIHESLKEHHHAAMAHWSGLLKEISEALESLRK